MTERSFNAEAWQRMVIESLRPIDGRALFWIGLTEIDFRDVSDREPEDFPSDELVTAVDAWLATVDPDGGDALWEWTGSGVRIGFRARGRSFDLRGWRAEPSLNLLEQLMADLHLIPGQLISLELAEVDALAAGTIKVVGGGVSYRETFSEMAKEMRYFERTLVAELSPNTVTNYAGMLGLVESPPSLGNFEEGWRTINRRPPNS